MRIRAYSTCESYDVKLLQNDLKQKEYSTKFYDKEALYFSVDEVYEQAQGEAFIFNFGCAVFWGEESANERKIIADLERYASRKSEDYATESCYFKVDYDTPSIVIEEEDLIILDDDSPIMKLAVSFALAQSAKLSFFEEAVEETINANRDIPEQLMNSGKILLSRKALSKKVGELFVKKSSVNLFSYILDTPDFFWRRPKYEPFYQMCAKFMDISLRVEILNQKLEVIREMYGILSSELQHIHTSRLEIIIIFLIALEVLIVISKEVIHYFFG